MIFKENPVYLQERIIELETELEESKKKINYGYGFNESNAIAVIWSIEDVKCVAGERQLTDEECMDILEELQDNHDAEYGINWVAIDAEIDSMVIAKEKNNDNV